MGSRHCRSSLGAVPCSGFAVPLSARRSYPHGTPALLLGADGHLGNDDSLRLLYGRRVSLEVAVLSNARGHGDRYPPGHYRRLLPLLDRHGDLAMIELTLLFPALLFIIALSATVGPH